MADEKRGCCFGHGRVVAQDRGRAPPPLEVGRHAHDTGEDDRTARVCGEDAVEFRSVGSEKRHNSIHAFRRRVFGVGVFRVASDNAQVDVGARRNKADDARCDGLGRGVGEVGK